MKSYAHSAALVLALAMVSGSMVKGSDMDRRIESAAERSYVFMTHLKDDPIGVSANNGEVTLTGKVSEESHRTMAEDAVEALPGVTAVKNQIVVEREVAPSEPDLWLRMKVKAALVLHRRIDGLGVKVSAANGVVYLRGEAASAVDREIIEDDVRDVDGVKEVKNEMTVASVVPVPRRTTMEKIDDGSITALVKASLLAHRSTMGMEIHVRTRDGVVTLSGEVSDVEKKTKAEKLANDIPGVIRVINELIVHN